jgi:hypothetical protein
MNILINALGIKDSGGITVLHKALRDCKNNTYYSYIIICNDNKNIRTLYEEFKDTVHFKFTFVVSNFFIYRLYYENIIFRKIIKENNINLVYNFSGTSQFFLPVKQLIKIQNLSFYSKKLDDVYLKNKKYLLWLKQIYLKRIVFKSMIKNAKYFEIQSSHVKEYISDFIDLKEKSFYIKSDINVQDGIFIKPKNYDFSKKIVFLYIVGPHFEYIHKNIIDFTNVMLEFQRLNIDFEIKITLTKEQLNSSTLWNNKLNKNTNFLGYIDKTKIKQHFIDNTILISTSIIETLGLHVIEAIINGNIAIAPNELYSKSVYGSNILKYTLFDTKSLLKIILHILNNKADDKIYIKTLQNNLKYNEENKKNNIVDIFTKIIDN